MAETKDFTCRACGAQFDSRDKLDQHSRREHATQGVAGGGQQQYGDSGTQRSGQQTGSQGGQGGGGQGQQRSQGYDEGSSQRRPNEPREGDKRASDRSDFGDDEG